MLMLKIFIAAIIVIGLAEIAERSSSKVAGLLAGLPIGSALVLFFYALDFGPNFVEQVTPYNLLGLSASLSFVTFYYLGSKISQKYSIIFGVTFGLLAYTIFAYLLSLLTVSNSLIPSIILIVIIVITHHYFKNIPEVESSKKSKLDFQEMIIRGIVATFFVLLASYSPRFFSDNIAGILSSFPSSLLPLLLIIHISQGRELVHSVIKYLPLGYIGVMIYSIVVGIMYTTFGIYLGTVVALSISTSYLILLLVISSYKNKELNSL